MSLLLYPPHPRLDHRRYSSPSYSLTTTLPPQQKQGLTVPGAFPSPVNEDSDSRTQQPSELARELGYVPRQHTLHPSHKSVQSPPAAAAQEYFNEASYATYQRRSAITFDASEQVASSSSSHSHSPCSSPRVRALEPPHLPTLYELRSTTSSRRAASEAPSPHRPSVSPARSYTSPPSRESLRERMLSSLGLGTTGGAAIDIAPGQRNVSRSMDGHHARRSSVDASGSVDPRSVSSSSMGSAQKAFGALIAGERESSAATPRPPDVSATPRPGAVQAAAAANAQMEANRGAGGEPSWRSWVRGSRAAGRDASDATLHDRRVSVLTSDDERILREEPELDYAAMSAANGQRYAKDSFGRNSTASTGAASYLPVSENGRSRHGECNDAAVRREKRKKRHAPPELLVIVRPPPSKQGNPLNLQIQLVTPVPPPTANNSLSRNSTPGEVSLDETTNGGNTSMSSSGSGLQRSGSITSNRSMRSEVSSGGFSTASSTGAGRRVTPLYNLSFHQFLATTVTDAGTDQKVAKFGRKGVEIDGFGHLEPRELVQGVTDLRSLLTNGSSNGPLSTGGSDFSPPRGGSDVGVKANLAPTEEPPTSYEAMTAEAKSDSIGGKLLNKFKRLSLQARPSTAAGIVSTPAAASPLGRFNLGGGTAGHGKRTSIDMGNSTLADSLLAGSGSDIPQLTPAGGLSAIGTRRTDGYVWTVRRFTRRAPDDESHVAVPVVGPDGQNLVLANVWRRFNMHNRAGGDVRHPAPGEIPIRFEWTKDRERARRFRARSRRTSHARSTTDSFTSGGGAAGPRVVAAQRGSFDISAAAQSNRALRPPSTADSRPSSVHAPARRSTDGSALDDTGSSVAADEDTLLDDEEDDGAGSDPEESETPWSCHLVLGPDTRIPIGSLSPAPYHPKLVGQLAVPFPLPDLSASGLGADGAGLTREELKDIVNVTCLFLVIREGWGGLVKNKRKA